jgi:serine/threonine protein kinase
LEHGARVAVSTTHRERGELTPERWQQISRIFKSAILLDTEARAKYVAGQCGRDESLRSEVEKLLESHKEASESDFMDGIAAEAAAQLIIDEAGPQPPALTKGQQFGSYLILNSLGAGGMGEVYLATDARLDRTVALKVLSSDITQDKRRMQRFRQEAKVASSLNQPNILTVFEFGEVDGLTFLAPEYIDGETLRDHLHGKQLKLNEVLDISIQVLAALDAAHEARIVHRDIKPENVMIRRRDRLVKVLDFGLAKLSEKKASTMQAEESEAATAFKTAPGTVMGTVNYMSPEQATAKVVDERTDIWSTGVMIYEMVTGAQPFSGSTTSHTIVQILEKEPAPLANVPAELQRIVTKAMTKDPGERYQTAKDMLIDLRSLKKQLDLKAEIDRTSSPETEPPVVVRPDPPARDSDKKRVLAIAIAGMVLVTAAIFAVNIWRSSRARTNGAAVVPPATPVVTDERTLTYWITVQKFKEGKLEKPFTMAGEINFETDYRIRVSVSSPEAGYLYILNEGPASTEPEYVVLFPSPTANDGASYLEAGKAVQIPDQSWFQFDKQQGVEKLWLVFSKDAVPELEAVKEFASTRTRGLVTDPAQNKAIQKFLNSVTVKPAAEKSETLTTLKAAGKHLVYPIRLEHH